MTPDPYPHYWLKARGRLYPIGHYQEMPYGRVFYKLYQQVNPRSGAQQGNRARYVDAYNAWRALPSSAKVYYNRLRYPRSMSGWNRFFRLYAQINPSMIIYWGNLEKSAGVSQTIEEVIAAVESWETITLKPKDANIVGAAAATLSQIEGTYIDYDVLVFADGATKEAYWQFVVPQTYNGDNFYISLYFLIGATASASSSDAVLWRALSPDEAIDGALGGLAQTTRDYGAAGLAAGDLWIRTHEITTNKPTAGELMFFDWRRFGAAAADTIGEDVKLLGVKIAFPCDTS